MKNVFVLTMVVMGLTQSAFATAQRSGLTASIEDSSKSLYSKTECSMEDYTCQKIVLDMGREQALQRVIAEDYGGASDILKQAIKIKRLVDPTLSNASDAEVEAILATEVQ